MPAVILSAGLEQVIRRAFAADSVPLPGSCVVLNCNAPVPGEDLCKKHAAKFGKDGCHGKVTGEIPEKKLKEFEKKYRSKTKNAWVMMIITWNRSLLERKVGVVRV